MERVYIPTYLSVRLVERTRPPLFFDEDEDGDGVFHIVVGMLPNVESTSLRS